MKKKTDPEAASRQASIRSTVPESQHQKSNSSSLLSNINRKFSKSNNKTDDSSTMNYTNSNSSGLNISNPQLQQSQQYSTSAGRRGNEAFHHTDSPYKKRQPSVSSSYSNQSQASLPLSKATTLNNSNYSLHDVSPPSPGHSRRSSTWTNSASTNDDLRSINTPNKKQSALQRIHTNTSIMSSGSSSLAGVGMHDFVLEQPKENWEIDEMFNELMTKRDFKSLPDAAKKQMKEYPISKKWMLIYQDALSEKKKQERSKKGLENPASPETYVRLLMDKSISVRQLGNLWVSLRTEPVDWVREFIDAQGPVALATVLQQLHTRSTTDLLNDEFLEKEISIIRCLRTIINNQRGANYALDSKICVPAIAGALISTKLATRRLVTDMLSFLAHFRAPEGYHQVLRALNSIPPDNIHFQAKSLDKRNSIVSQPIGSSGLKRFEQWLRIVEQTLEGRGKMGSMVGASEELKSSGATGESQLVDYALATIILINSIAEGGEDFKVRTHIRAQMKSGGLQKIFKKFHKLHSDLIDDKIREFEDAAAEDYDALLKAERIGEDVDLNDPISLIKNIWSKVQHSESETYFLSAMQHLFLSQSETGKSMSSTDTVRSYRLIDGLISNITMGASSDDDAALNIAIHRLYDGLQTDEVARRAILESREATRRAEEAIAERDELGRQISLGSDGMLERLSNEVKEQEIILMKQRKLNESLSSELEELKRKHILEKHEQELEMREMLIMLNNANDASGSIPKAPIVDRLKAQLTRKKNQYRIDNKKYGNSVEPNGRLRALRDQMEDIEQQARELEMTNFTERKRDTITTAPPSVHSSPQKLPKEEDLSKLDALRHKLETLQNQSNDILKFDTDAKQKELMNKQKLMAMDRLKELQSRFKNLNIDFSPSESMGGEGYRSLDPKNNENFHFELSEIERLSEKVQAELQVPDEVPSKSFLENLEAKYIRGQKQPEEKPDFTYRSVVADKVRSSKGFEPSFLKELTSTVGKKEAISDADGNEHGDNDEMLPPPLPKTNSKHTNSIKSSSSTSSSTPSPLPPSLGSSAPLPPPLPHALGGGSPPPPPPPLPLVLGGSSSAPMPPPPPPLPFGNANSAPPAPPLPCFGSGQSPPPPPPFPMPKSKTPIPSPLLPQSPSLFEKYPRPKKKLKQLHWEKVESTENSFWESAGAEKVATDLLNRGILDELENIFAMKEVKKLATKKAGETEKLTFLARDVSQQFSINLHMFSQLTDEQLVGKILRCDNSVLELPNVIEFLSKQELSEIPNGLARNFEPYRTIWANGFEKQPEKDPTELHRSDRIYLELFYNLQDYWQSRMRAVRVISSYEKEYNDLVRKLRLIDEATENIQNSLHLRRVFDVILAVGNYMNDTAKQAQGFKLSTLQRLTFMKDDKNSITFLHYVEKVIRNAYPDEENFLEELNKCYDVAKVSVEQLANDSREFTQSVKNVEASIDVGNLSDSSKFHPKDRVLTKVLPVLPEAKRKGDLLSDQTRITISDFEKLMRYFGEDPTDSFAKNSFFRKFVDFMNDYKKARRENLAREEEERAYEQRKKMMETPKRNVSSSSIQQGEEAGENVMDALLEKLKAAGPTKGQASSARKRALARKLLLGNKKPTAEDSDEEDDDSLMDSGDQSPSGKSIAISSPQKTGSSSNEVPSGTNEDDDDVGFRARNLLQELRGGGSSSNLNIESGQSRVHLLRQQQRLKRKQSQAENLSSSDMDTVSVNSSPEDKQLEKAETGGTGTPTVEEVVDLGPEEVEPDGGDDNAK